MIKTIDKKVVYKVADLSQIMVCSHDLADTANAKDAKSAKKVRFCLNSFSRKLKFFFNDWLERERRYPTITLFASFFSYATRYFAPSNSISNCCCMWISTLLSNQQYTSIMFLLEISIIFLKIWWKRICFWGAKAVAVPAWSDAPHEECPRASLQED